MVPDETEPKEDYRIVMVFIPFSGHCRVMRPMQTRLVCVPARRPRNLAGSKTKLRQLALASKVTIRAFSSVRACFTAAR